jgi:hypothetical protein
MTEISETRKTESVSSLPFLLKAVAFFLAADGLFKLVAVLSGLVPGTEIFGYYDSRYYYALVAIVDFSLSVQILGRAHYAWVWGLAFFLLQSVVLLTYFTFTSPMSWLVPGILGRTQIILTVALYMFLAWYFASKPVREVLSAHEEKS